MAVGEVFAGLSAFKTMFDMAKALKDINDATIRNGAVIELQEQILSAQAAQTALLEGIGALKAKIAGFETWETEKQKYELKNLGWGSFAYMLKPDARKSAPAHWVCTNCYGNHKISVINWGMAPNKKHGPNDFYCPCCFNEVNPAPTALQPGTQNPRWLDE